MVMMATQFQAFRLALNQRIPRITRGCMASAVSISRVKDDRFAVTIYWRDKGGDTEKYIKEYVASALFVTNGTMGPKLKRPVCRLTDELIREVLRVRKLAQG
jgi:hypothetical protein